MPRELHVVDMSQVGRFCEWKRSLNLVRRMIRATRSRLQSPSYLEPPQKDVHHPCYCGVPVEAEVIRLNCSINIIASNSVFIT